MIIDLTVRNFRSFRDEQTLSLNVETARARHPSNYSLVDNGRLAVLRSAAILGANASGKSNVLRALAALRWIIVSSSDRKEGQAIPPYEPFRLSEDSTQRPIEFEVEFVVPSGVRYRYELAFTRRKIERERLFSFARGSKALVFERDADDTWQTIKFGGTYKGGTRKFSFFDNASYLSRAGNDASASEAIREIYKYFQQVTFIPAGNRIFATKALADAEMMRAVSELVCLADTGITKVTLEENDGPTQIKLPDELPEEIKEAILAENKMATKFWVKSSAGELLSFDTDDMSDGTVRLVELLPLILKAFADGSVLLFDEMDAHLHTDLVDMILRLFHDDQVNSKGAQIIFSTHDTNILDADQMRRDQIWFVAKVDGASQLKSLDEYDKKYVRQDSPFESFYRDGRLGALPQVSYGGMRQVLLSALDAI